MKACETHGGRRPGLLAIGLCGALVLLISVFTHSRAAGRHPIHFDEPIWAARAYFFKLAFLEHDLAHELWTGYDSFDQPHVADFLIGVALFLAGEPIPDGPVGESPDAIRPRLVGTRLLVARAPGIALGALVAPIVFATGTLATGRLAAGTLAGLLYALHPLAVACQPRAMADAPLLLFCSLPVLLLTWSMARGRQGGGRWTPYSVRGLVGLAVGPLCLGLAAGTKLVGGFTACGLVAALVVAWACQMVARDRSARHGDSYLFAYLALLIAWTIAANPTLYSDPVDILWKALKFRWEIAQSQRASHPDAALDGLTGRAGAAYENLYTGAVGRAGVVLLAAGALGLVALALRELGRLRARQGPSPGLPVLAWLAVLTCGLLPTIPLNWDRYFLPFLPGVAVVSGHGGMIVFDWLRSAHGAAWRVGRRLKAPRWAIAPIASRAMTRGLPNRPAGTAPRPTANREEA